MHFYIIIIAGLVIGISLFLNNKKTASYNKILKVLGIALFVVYCLGLLSDHKIDETFNLFLVDINTTDINPYDTWLFGGSVLLSLLMILLRWVTTVFVAYMVLGAFFQFKRVNLLVATTGLLIGVLNLVFFNSNLIAFEGAVNNWGYRSIQFMLQASLMISIGIITLLSYLEKEKRLDMKEIGKSLILIPLAMIALFPQGLIYNLFGNYGQVAKDFKETHIIMLLVPVVALIVIYRIMRNKPQENKNFVITFMAFAAFFQYFYEKRIGLAALPLHLCNMAVILMLVATVFKIRGFFYFNYFANVLGALAALIMPNFSATADANSIVAWHFAFNHWNVLIWPILAVALQVWEKPKLKDMYQALIVFAGYYALVIFLNAWFNNYTSVDYFFTYSDHLTGIFNLRKLQYDFIASFTIGDLVFKFYWLYQIILFVVFIVLMFLSWYVYDASYIAADNHRLLKEKQKQIMLDELRLKELLDGRKIGEPINLEGINMINIKNFSKRYGNSKDYAVNDFSLEIHKGEVFGFLGHNGAGKSTTIKCLVGIQSITEGEMEICGYSIKSQPLEAKLQIGYVSDNHAVYEKLTGREYIEYISDLYKVDPQIRDERLEVLLKRFNLAHAIDREAKSYSHGMKQKLVVIASLIHEPPVWILDEPLTGLDPTSAFQIKESMKEHAEKGNIVFFSSHVIEVVEKVCDRIAIINHGKLQGVYDMKDLKKRKVSLEELYMQHVNPLEVK